MSRPLPAIDADIKAARARVAALVRERRAAEAAADPASAAARSERFRALAAMRRSALPPMTDGQRIKYEKLRYKFSIPRDAALKAVGVRA